MTRKAIVLLSGGLDSTTTLAIAKDQGYQAITLSFDYGQRHRVELDRARDIARRMGAAEHRVLNVDLAAIGHSALTADIEVPTGRVEAEMASGIPITYVPARNTIFLAYALAVAEVTGARDVFVGVNAVDYSGYPDCRPEYIAAFEALANLATRSGVEGETPIKIHAPLIDLSKADIIRLGLGLGVDYSLTHSCYQPDASGLACGACDSCRLRLKGFHDAGAKDPLEHQKK